MPTLSDKQVIRKIRMGQIDNFYFIVTKYAPRIKKFMEAKLFVKVDAEDLVQNTFVNFYKSISRFDENQPVLPYIYQIARNELKMYYRSRKATVPLKDEIAADPNDREVFDENLLKNLKSQDKKMLLDFSEGFSYEELAKKYKMTLNTLKSKIRRARLKVKKNYEKT